MDALYSLLMLRDSVSTETVNHISSMVSRYAECAIACWNERGETIAQEHPHLLLAAASAFGLLQRLLP